jgi:uncharacterized protein (TIRG00374 family)
VTETNARIWNKALFRNIFGFGVSGILLWLTIHQSRLEFSEIKISRDQLSYYLLAEFFFFLSVVAYAIRAQIVWRKSADNKDSVYTLASIVLGNFYNSVLPANLGEGVRAWHFAKKNKVFFLKSLAAVITEKWIDAQTFICMALVIILLKPFVGHYILYSILFTALLAFVLSIVYVIMRRIRAVEKSLWGIVLFFGKAGKVLYKLYRYTCSHIDNMMANKQIGNFLFWCVFVLSLNVGQFYFLMKAAGVTGSVCSAYSALLVALSMMIITIVPSAPGNIGVLHYGVYSALILSSYQNGMTPDAIALKSFALFAIYVHLSYLFPEVIFGALFLVRERKIMFER